MKLLANNPVLKAYLTLSGVFRAKRNAPHRPIRRILVANIAHLGDVVLATSMLPTLRHLYPKAEIGFLVGSWARCVVETHPEVAYVHCFDHWKLRRAGKQAGFRSCVAGVRAKRYDCAIDLYPFYPNASLLLWWAGIPQRIGFTSGGWGNLFTEPHHWHVSARHITSYYAGLLGMDAAWLRPSLPRHRSPIEGRYIVLHPGSGDPQRKGFDCGIWQRLAALATERVVLTGAGESEIEMGRSIRGVMNRCGQLSWPDFVGIVSNAAYVVCVDSVARHIASASNVPCTTLLRKGASDTLFDGVGPNASSIGDERLEGILEALEGEALGMAPDAFGDKFGSAALELRNGLCQ